ncbi:hypothetical protein POL68_32805 [Stigmatella sp. ncwal1]|uniref:Uncharacterized protein n=1 Tax=Stigmatella ashevillensis TaxID=2995309 RepID=A0ABT5DJQ5_9BACT|nr:hypothetical protein [Stigmatella ashevillena]MDC0713289.1 hypothetical protein [Stigmatella ashevillena]
MAQALFHQQFGMLSADKQRFHDVMRASFGDGYDVRTAERFRLQALAGDFDWLPPVRWVDSAVLAGSRGAYDTEFDSMCLDRSLQRFPSLAEATFSEVAGHVLDSLLNPLSVQGRRGVQFRRILDGVGLGAC